MQPRFVFHYVHFTGARCIVTVFAVDLHKASINFSFRSHKGFGFDHVKRWAMDWDQWASAISIGNFDVPDPPGWYLLSDLQAA